MRLPNAENGKNFTPYMIKAVINGRGDEVDWKTHSERV